MHLSLDNGINIQYTKTFCDNQSHITVIIIVPSGETTSQCGNREHVNDIFCKILDDHFNGDGVFAQSLFKNNVILLKIKCPHLKLNECLHKLSQLFHYQFTDSDVQPRVCGYTLNVEHPLFIRTYIDHHDIHTSTILRNVYGEYISIPFKKEMNVVEIQKCFDEMFIYSNTTISITTEIQDMDNIVNSISEYFPGKPPVKVNNCPLVFNTLSLPSNQQNSTTNEYIKIFILHDVEKIPEQTTLTAETLFRTYLQNYQCRLSSIMTINSLSIKEINTDYVYNYDTHQRALVELFVYEIKEQYTEFDYFRITNKSIIEFLQMLTSEEFDNIKRIHINLALENSCIDLINKDNLRNNLLKSSDNYIQQMKNVLDLSFSDFVNILSKRYTSPNVVQSSITISPKGNEK